MQVSGAGEQRAAQWNPPTVLDGKTTEPHRDFPLQPGRCSLASSGPNTQRYSAGALRGLQQVGNMMNITVIWLDLFVQQPSISADSVLLHYWFTYCESSCQKKPSQKQFAKKHKCTNLAITSQPLQTRLLNRVSPPASFVNGGIVLSSLITFSLYAVINRYFNVLFLRHGIFNSSKKLYFRIKIRNLYLSRRRLLVTTIQSHKDTGHRTQDKCNMMSYTIHLNS